MKSSDYRTDPLFLRNQQFMTGQFDMPFLYSQSIDLDDISLLGFDKSRLFEFSPKKRQDTVHFFLDDYKFDEVWNILSDEFRPLLEAYSELHNDLNSTLTDADREWAECMADNRFPGLSQPQDARNAIIHKIGELPTSATIGVVPGGELPPELRAIAEQEIEMAIADFDCRVSTNFRRRQESRWFDAETQFVADHHDAVAALQDALAQQS